MDQTTTEPTTTITWNAYAKADPEYDAEELPHVEIFRDGNLIDTIRVTTLAGRARVAGLLGVEEAEIAMEDAYALAGWA